LGRTISLNAVINTLHGAGRWPKTAATFYTNMPLLPGPGGGAGRHKLCRGTRCLLA